MRNKKRVLKGFHYWECDTFADYLHNMSAEGWHFTEWKLGLIFEKGEPGNFYYDVEPFPKGSEMDTGPERDTEEYAEYCEAAGWKFIDSKHRFCVFRRDRDDAVPIVTQEERLHNIIKAGWRKWMSDSIGMFFITILIWLEFLTINFEQWIFFDLMIYLILAVTLGSIIKIIECFVMILEGHRKKSEIAEGKVPYYGGKLQTVMSCFRNYMGIVVITVFLGAASIQRYYYLAVIGIVFLLMIYAIIAGMAIWRPSRSDNWMIQIGGSFSVVFLAIPIIIFIVILIDDHQENALPRNIPLVQNDYKKMAGEIDFTDEGHLQGVLGSMYYFQVGYKEPGESQEGKHDSLWYYVYSSSHPWILNKIWRQHMEKADKPKDCSNEWQAEYAVCSGSGGHIYSVLYKEKLLYLYSDEPLNKKQIKIIRTNLELGDSM